MRDDIRRRLHLDQLEIDRQHAPQQVGEKPERDAAAIVPGRLGARGVHLRCA